MPSTYTVNLGIEKPATGEQSGTWGDTTNLNFDMLDQAINGAVSITLASAGTSGSPNTLAISDGAVSDGRNKWIEFTDGGDLGATAYVQLTPNDAEKIVFIRNSLSGSRSVILFQGTYDAGRDLEVPAGVDMVVKFSGGGATATTTNIFQRLRTEALNIAGTTTVDGVIDDDTMATASATKLSTSESIKAYVDATAAAQNELSEVLANGNTSGANNLIIDNGQALTTNTINETTAASGVTIDSVLLKDGRVEASTASTTDPVLKLTDTANIAYDFTFPDTSTVKLGVNATSSKTLSITNDGSGSFKLSVEGDITGGGGLAIDTDTLYVDATNDRVGVNTPTNLLDTQLQIYTAAAAITPLIKLQANISANDSSEGMSIDFVSSGDQTAVGSRIIGTRAASGANMDLRFHVGRNNFAMIIDKDKQVGIGTTDPQALTHLVSSEAGSLLRIESTNAGAGVGPTIDLFRNSGSPAASDILGRIDFLGEDTASNETVYARMYSTIIDPTSTTEDGNFVLSTMYAGSLASRIIVDADGRTNFQSYQNVPQIRLYDDLTNGAVHDGWIVIPHHNTADKDIAVIKGRANSATTAIVDIGGDSSVGGIVNSATTVNILTSTASTTENGTVRLQVTDSLVYGTTDFQVGASYNMWVDVSSGELGVGTGSPLAQYHFVDNAVTNRYVDGSVAGSGMLLESTDARLQILARNDGGNGSSLILSNDQYSWVVHSIPQAATFFSNAMRLGYYTATASGQDINANATYTFTIMPDDVGIVGIGAFSGSVPPERTLDLFSDNNWSSLRIADAINTEGAKDGMITGRPYTLSQPDVVIANLRTEASVNVLQIGGQNTHTANNWNGGDGVQTVTQIDFFTASAINTQSSNSDVQRMRIQNDGDILFYEDGGGVGMFYDASAAAIGLGTAGAPTAGHTLEIKNEAGVGNNTIFAMRTSGTSDSSYISLGDTSERSRILGSYGTGGGGNVWFYTDTTGGTIQSRMFIDNTYTVGVGVGSAANFRADVASGAGTNFIVRGEAPAITVSNTTETEGKIRIVDRDDQSQNLTISYHANTQQGYLQVDANKQMWFHSDGNTYFGPLGTTQAPYYDAGNASQIFPQVGIVGNDAGTKNANTLAIFDFGTGGNTEPQLVLGHSTSGTVNDNSTALVTGNNLGRILFNGSDTAKMANGAFIFAEAAGTWTSTTWPTNLMMGVELDSAGPRNAFMLSHDAKVGISDTVNWDTNSQVPQELLHLRSDSPYLLIDVYGAENLGGIKFHDGDSGDPEAQKAAIVFDAGSANDLSFRVNDFSVERMKITSAGEIPRPYQPAFRARRTSAININTQLAAGGVVPFDSESVDINSDYSPTTYRFTAPVDGTYVFFVVLSLSGGNESTDDSIQGYFATNGSSDGTAGMFMNPSYLTKAGVEMVQSGTYVKALSSGDYVEYRLTDVQQTAQLDANSFWGGYLL